VSVVGCGGIDRVGVRFMNRIMAMKETKLEQETTMERNSERDGEGNEKGNRPGFESMALLNSGARLRSRLIDSA